MLSSPLVLAGCSTSLGEVTQSALRPEGASPQLAAAPEWRYRPLDPNAVADRAYAIYPDGGCMYAMVGSVISLLAERYGEPFRSFPFAMMRYGDGGVAKWGSLCGVVNGAAAIIGLFYQEDQEARERLATAFAHWYESNELPVYRPHSPPSSLEITACKPGSILCHLSVTEWCKASGHLAFSKEKSERYRRLTADGAKHLVMSLNEAHAEIGRVSNAISDHAKDCNACHGKTQLADAMVKMDCSRCHDLPASHAVQTQMGQ